MFLWKIVKNYPSVITNTHRICSTDSEDFSLETEKKEILLPCIKVRADVMKKHISNLK